MDSVNLSTNEQKVLFEGDSIRQIDLVIFCCKGEAQIKFESEMITISSGMALVLKSLNSKSVCILSKGNTALILSQIEEQKP